MPIFLSPLLGQINYNNVNPCPLGGVSCVPSGGGAAYLQNFLAGQQGLLFAFSGILLGMLVFYGIKLLVGSRSENVLTEVKQAYGHALFGAVVVGGSLLLANTFAANSGGAVIVASPFNAGVSTVIRFLTGLTATLVLVNVVVQGIRLIIAMEDGDMDKAKKGFLYGVVGAGITLLAIPIVRTFTEVNTSGGGGITGAGPQEALVQIVGIGQYLTLILGALSVFGIMIAGIMLVVSYDDSLKDRARKLIITSLVALVVSLVAYGIVTLFM